MPTTSARLTVVDLLELAGAEKIQGFKWGDALCGVINPYLSVDRRLGLSNTGTEALAIMKALPAHVQVLINETRIDVLTGTIVVEELRALEHELGVDRDVEEPSFSPHPFDRQGGRQAPDYERFGSNQMGECEVPAGPARFQRVRKARAPNSTIMIMVAVTLVALAFFLAFTTAKIANESGTQPNSGTLDVVIKTLGGVFRDAANTNPDSAGKRTRDDAGSDPLFDDQPDESDPAMEEDVSAPPRPTYGPD